MGKHVHVCWKCGARIKCDAPATRTFEATTPTLAPSTSAPWPSIQYEVYYGVRTISDAFYKALAVWIPVNAIAYGIFKYLDAPVFVPIAFNIGTIAACMSAFGKVPSWHNAVQTEAPQQREPESKEQEDKREFVGWKLDVTDRTKTTMRLTMVEEWYTPPCPLDQAMSYALALVNNHFEWFDERHLKDHGAKISGGNYRALRSDWLERKWCAEYGKKTLVTDKRMILKIAFDKPE